MGDLIEALQIFYKYGNPDRPTNCVHDELQIMQIGREEVSDEDAARLEELDFDWDTVNEVWYSFRFGSA